MEDKKFVCDICGQEFCSISLKANHVRWEHKTSDRSFHHSQKWVDAMKQRKGVIQNNIRGKYSCRFCGKVWETTKEGHTVHEKFCKENPNKVVYKSHTHTEKTKRELSEMALNNHYRRIMRHTVEFHGFLCDSKWEVEMIKKFEELNEPFIKPDPIAYIDDERKTTSIFSRFLFAK